MHARRTITRLLRALRSVYLAAVIAGCGNTSSSPVVVPPAEGLAGFEGELDAIRVNLRIPAMAAATAQGDRIVWSRGFGLADVEGGRPATDATSFHVASVTKPIAAIALMQLVEQGMVGLDDPVSDYGVALGSGGLVTVRNLLDHTSEGTPGTAFRYNHERYARLGDVMRAASGKTFAQLLSDGILRPLDLRHSAPDPSLLADFLAVGLDRQDFISNVAMPYELVDGQVVPSGYARHFSPGAGLVTSVRDLAAISVALDRDLLLAPATKQLMLSPSIQIGGPDRTYGLGWFVQTHLGVRLEWHYGWMPAASALLLRAPAKGLTFVVVANTSRLSGAYDLASGDVMQSEPARLFVESFVLGDQPLPVGPP